MRFWPILILVLGVAACSDDNAATDNDGDVADARPGRDGGMPDTCNAGEECGPGADCLNGICRYECWLGYCVERSGEHCHEGLNLCVPCVEDIHCRGGNLRCSEATWTCEDRPVDPSQVVVGVMYHQWWTPARWQTSPANYAYEPLLGHYDNADSAVISQHLDWCDQAGVNTLVFDTWITDRDWSWVEPNTLAVMSAADARGVQYFLLIDGWFELEGPDDGYDANAIAAKIVQRFEAWLDRPGYLQVDGRPVLFFWAAWGKPCTLFDKIRTSLEAALGPVYLTGNNGDPSCWDRVMMYNPYTSQSGSHADQLDRQHEIWSGWERDDHPWAPTALPGYDDTHVRDGNPAVPLDPGFFRDSIRAALQYNQHVDHPWLFVCSWSEWHEGSQIEPSSDFTDPLVFLQVLHDELDAAGWLP